MDLEIVRCLIIVLTLFLPKLVLAANIPPHCFVSRHNILDLELWVFGIQLRRPMVRYI
jgi:hypothetical protein